MPNQQFDVLGLEQALRSLGETLGVRGLSFEIVVVGGSALLLKGVTQRPTRDLDVMAIVEGGGYQKAEPLPADLYAAVRDVGDTLGIGPDWLNGKASCPKAFNDALRSVITVLSRFISPIGWT